MSVQNRERILLSTSSRTIQLANQAITPTARSGWCGHLSVGLFARNPWITMMAKNNPPEIASVRRNWRFSERRYSAIYGHMAAPLPDLTAVSLHDFSVG